MSESDPIFGEVIYAYTRKQAIEDGVLVDLTEWAKETGFRYSVACTRSIWDSYITPPAAVAEGHGQSERGRAHDLLHMLMTHIRHRKGLSQGGQRVDFSVLFLQEANKKPQEVEMYSMCGPGDNAEPVITIMLPHED